jgi:hypothetical protein
MNRNINHFEKERNERKGDNSKKKLYPIAALNVLCIFALYILYSQVVFDISERAKI